MIFYVILILHLPEIRVSRGPGAPGRALAHPARSLAVRGAQGRLGGVPLGREELCCGRGGETPGDGVQKGASRSPGLQAFDSASPPHGDAKLTSTFQRLQ